jgi:hypothetical protein
MSDHQGFDRLNIVLGLLIEQLDKLAGRHTAWLLQHGELQQGALQQVPGLQQLLGNSGSGLLFTSRECCGLPEDLATPEPHTISPRFEVLVQQVGLNLDDHD